MQQPRSALFLSLIAVTLSACSGLREKGPGLPDEAVWADDASELAVIKNNGETHRIFLSKPDGSGRRPLTQERPYPNGSVYYMKQAGYLVVESLPPGGGVKIDQILLNGQEKPVIETLGKTDALCAGQATAAVTRPTVIPSPDGRVLAQISSQECATVSVDFLDPGNLFVEDGYTWNIERPAWATWHPGGYLVVALEGGNQAWKLAPQSPPEPTTYPRCTYPRTSSSAIAADGRLASLRGDTLDVAAPQGGQVFGCQ